MTDTDRRTEPAERDMTFGEAIEAFGFAEAVRLLRARLKRPPR